MDIRRIPILPLRIVNAYLLVDSGGAVLVDTGLPGSEPRIAAALAAAGLGWRDLRLVVVTHAHVDHAGCAAAIRRHSGAPVAAHAGDLPYFRREAAMEFCPTGWAGRVFRRTGLMDEPYEPFTPDLLLRGEDVLDLAPFGCRGRLVPTPGHTAGSLAVLLDDGDVLAGDLVASGWFIGGVACQRRPIRPAFEDDPARVAGQLRRLAGMGGRRFHPGHGAPLPAASVEAHAARLAALSARR